MVGKITTHLRTGFSKVEDKWPGIVEQLHRRENVNDSLLDIFQFMILQRRGFLPVVMQLSE